jgi:hypothetical protein
MREPFAGVAFTDVRLCRQFRWRHGTLLLERLVQAELVAHAHHGHAECAAEIAQNLADKLIEFSFVDHCRPRPDWFRFRRRPAWSHAQRRNRRLTELCRAKIVHTSCSCRICRVVRSADNSVSSVPCETRTSACATDATKRSAPQDIGATNGCHNGPGECGVGSFDRR